MPHAQPPAVYQLAPSAIPTCAANPHAFIQGGTLDAAVDSPSEVCADNPQVSIVRVNRCDPPLVIVLRKGQLPLCTARVTADMKGTAIVVRSFKTHCAHHVVHENKDHVTVIDCDQVVVDKPAPIQPSGYLFKPCPKNVVRDNGSSPVTIQGCGNVVTGNRVRGSLGVKGNNDEIKDND